MNEKAIEVAHEIEQLAFDRDDDGLRALVIRLLDVLDPATVDAQ